jgi:hypothetical protein
LAPPPPGFDRIPETEPPSNGSKKHFCALSFWLVKPPGLLGNRHGFTPASAIGPGSCSGNWASLAVDHRYPAVVAAQCSSYAAMHSWPFARKARRPDPLSSEAANRVAYSERFEHRPCAVCNEGSDTIHHLVTSCTHEAMLILRPALWASALAFMEQLYGRLRTLAERSHKLRAGEGIPGLQPMDEEVTRGFVLTRRPPPPSAESAFLLYWLLMVTPWPAHVAAHDDGPWQPIARTFGTLFDNISLNNTSLRSTSELWTSWAESELRLLAYARCSALRGRQT